MGRDTNAKGKIHFAQTGNRGHGRLIGHKRRIQHRHGTGIMKGFEIFRADHQGRIVGNQRQIDIEDSFDHGVLYTFRKG